MSEILPLHRKYRPSTLAEVYGNARVKASIASMLKGNNRPQVLLFTGAAGCGKTSFGRLVGKEYSCENRNDITGACGECESCKLFSEYIKTGNDGLFMDLREFNIGKDNGKADIDSIISEAEVPSITGGWKIFIFDECHTATPSAQNSLLKLVEEPPENLLLIFCTTNPERLLPTLMSRMQYVFKVQKPTNTELVTLMAHIAEKENVQYDAKGLSKVAIKCNFTVRDSLMAMERVIREAGKVTNDTVSDILSSVSEKYFFDFYDKLINDKVGFDYISFISNLKANLDLSVFIDELISFTKQGIYVSNGVTVDGFDAKDIKAYSKVFGSFTRGEIAAILNKLVKIKEKSLNTQDVETYLLLWGYTGIESNVSSEAQLDGATVEMQNELEKFKSVASENFTKETTVSEEEKEEIVTQEMTSIQSDDDILDMFGGVLLEE